jgi:ribosomal protein S10
MGIDDYCNYYGTAAPKPLVLPDPVPAPDSVLTRTIRKALHNHKREQFERAFDRAVARQQPDVQVTEVEVPR